MWVVLQAGTHSFRWLFFFLFQIRTDRYSIKGLARKACVVPRVNLVLLPPSHARNPQRLSDPLVRAPSATRDLLTPKTLLHDSRPQLNATTATRQPPRFGERMTRGRRSATRESGLFYSSASLTIKIDVASTTSYMAPPVQFR